MFSGSKVWCLYKVHLRSLVPRGQPDFLFVCVKHEVEMKQIQIKGKCMYLCKSSLIYLSPSSRKTPIALSQEKKRYLCIIQVLKVGSSPHDWSFTISSSRFAWEYSVRRMENLALRIESEDERAFKKLAEQAYAEHEAEKKLRNSPAQQPQVFNAFLLKRPTKHLAMASLWVLRPKSRAHDCENRKPWDSKLTWGQHRCK